MIVGHDNNLQYLKDIANSRNYSHAYLFVGPDKVGKTKMADYFAKSLLCEKPINGESCGNCASCKVFKSGNQPDVLMYDGYDNLKVEEIRELIHFLELKPYQSSMKIAIIAHVERMSVSAANSFLKTLEEPAPNTLIILTSENSSSLLPTIVSRTQVLRFGFVSTKKIEAYLVDKYDISPEKVNDIANFSTGKIGFAVDLAENPEKMKEIKVFLKDYLVAKKSKFYAECLLEAEKLTEKKDNIVEYLTYVENYYQAKIGSEKTERKELLNIATELDKIAQSKEYILKNVNLRLVLESLLLRGV